MSKGLSASQKLIEKTIATSDFLSGGLLNPDQQKVFINLVKKFSSMLGAVRFINMPQASMQLDKLHIGEPITAGAAENTATPNSAGVKVNQVELAAKKLKSGWNTSTETFQQNIEQNNFEMTLMESMAQRISTDLEMLAIQGDESLTATDPTASLLKVNDGWLKLAEGAHVLDAGGNFISSAIFREAIKLLPRQYRADPGLNFVMSRTLMIDWMTLLGEQGTGAAGGLAVADAAISTPGGGQASVAPYGWRILTADLFPDDLPVVPPAAAGANPAQLDGVRKGPFAIRTGINDVFDVTVDDGSGPTPVSTTLPAGVLDLVAVLRAINARFSALSVAAFAVQNGDDEIRLETIGTGVGQSITIGAANANATLGYTDLDSVTGAAAGGTLNEGTRILLTNPQNLVHGMLDGTRIFTEFDKDFDRVETVVYNHTDAQIENLDACVLVTNVRLRPFA